jgi:catechol 2,3-dioxygenase-like lactoylglutathione lyase family enzyme
MRLRGAMLYVKDLPRMKAFYGAMLGATPNNREWTDTWARFDAGGAHFALHAMPEEIARQTEITSPPQPREKNPLRIDFEVQDVAAERARLASLGITLVERPWGAWDGIDPEGNVFGIRSPAED